MEYRRFGNTIIARIDKGEEILAKVKELAEKERIRLASVTALGAICDFTAGVFDTTQVLTPSHPDNGTIRVCAPSRAMLQIFESC